MDTAAAMSMLQIVMVSSELFVMMDGEILRLQQCAGKVVASVLLLVLVIFLRQLGYSDGSATRNSQFGSVSRDFAMDEVSCSSSDYYLQDCSYFTDDNCGADEGAGVYCSTTGTSTYRPKTKK